MVILEGGLPCVLIGFRKCPQIRESNVSELIRLFCSPFRLRRNRDDCHRTLTGPQCSAHLANFSVDTLSINSHQRESRAVKEQRILHRCKAHPRWLVGTQLGEFSGLCQKAIYRDGPPFLHVRVAKNRMPVQSEVDVIDHLYQGELRVAPRRTPQTLGSIGTRSNSRRGKPRTTKTAP